MAASLSAGKRRVQEETEGDREDQVDGREGSRVRWWAGLPVSRAPFLLNR